MTKSLVSFVFFALAAGFAATAAEAQDCAAQCRALEMQCLKDNKGDSAKCNAITTQCYQSCKKPK